MPKLLMVDDEAEILEILRMPFELAGYEVFTALDSESAVEIVKTHKPDILLIDYKLPKMTGLELFQETHKIDPKGKAIMITGIAEGVEEIKSACIQAGISQFFQKPLQMEMVIKAVDALAKG